MTAYLFPDAGDLTQFSDEYAGASDDGQVLFEDDAEDTGD